MAETNKPHEPSEEELLDILAGEDSRMEQSNERLLELFRTAKTARLETLFVRHGVEPRKGIRRLCDEIRLDGSNTLASIFRVREGVAYLEMVRDVADQMKVPYEFSEDETEIEYAILGNVLKQFVEHATGEQREGIEEVLKAAGNEFSNLSRDLIRSGLAAGTLALLIKEVGAKIVAKIIRDIVVKLATRQAAKEAGKRAAQVAGYAIPLLNVALVAWTIVDIAGPAYRKTVPTVIEIALLRLEAVEK